MLCCNVTLPPVGASTEVSIFSHYVSFYFFFLPVVAYRGCLTLCCVVVWWADEHAAQVCCCVLCTLWLLNLSEPKRKTTQRRQHDVHHANGKCVIRWHRACLGQGGMVCLYCGNLPRLYIWCVCIGTTRRIARCVVDNQHGYGVLFNSQK